MVFQWKPGAQIKANPQTAGEVLTQLEQTKGLTPKNLLEASRPGDAPLHNEFEWDNDIAAENWRENQARYIIRQIVIAAETEEKQPVRAFFNVTGEVRQYKSLNAILSRPDEREQLLNSAKKELEAFRRKYESLSDELSVVFHAIEGLTA